MLQICRQFNQYVQTSIRMNVILYPGCMSNSQTQILHNDHLFCHNYWLSSARIGPKPECNATNMYKRPPKLMSLYNLDVYYLVRVIFCAKFIYLVKIIGYQMRETAENLTAMHPICTNDHQIECHPITWTYIFKLQSYFAQNPSSL